MNRCRFEIVMDNNWRVRASRYVAHKNGPFLGEMDTFAMKLFVYKLTLNFFFSSFG